MTLYEDLQRDIPDLDVEELRKEKHLEQLKFRVDAAKKYEDSQSARFEFLDKKASYCLKFSLTVLAAIIAYLYVSLDSWDGSIKQWLAVAALGGYSIVAFLGVRAVWPIGYGDPGLQPSALMHENVVTMEWQDFLVYWLKCTHIRTTTNDRVCLIRSRRNDHLFLSVLVVSVLLAVGILGFLIVKITLG